MKLDVDDMCFACGRKNPIGLKLQFHFDGDDYVTTFEVRPEHQGWAGIVHGGLLATALDMFRLENGRYPNQDEGLKALVEQPMTLPTWSGPYLRKRELPKDGWGRVFIYEIPANKGGIDYDLYSLGADGETGGEDDDADVGNW